MTGVIDMQLHRRKREAEMKELWHCTECECLEFLLAIDGSVICAGCRDLIEDLVTIEPTEETQ